MSETTAVVWAELLPGQVSTRNCAECCENNRHYDGITWYREPMVAEVGGITLLTKKKRASSGLRLILFLMRK